MVSGVVEMDARRQPVEWMPAGLGPARVRPPHPTKDEAVLNIQPDAACFLSELETLRTCGVGVCLASQHLPIGQVYA